jgi:hypothetical protein
VSAGGTGGAGKLIITYTVNLTNGNFLAFM